MDPQSGPVVRGIRLSLACFIWLPCSLSINHPKHCPLEMCPTLKAFPMASDPLLGGKLSLRSPLTLGEKGGFGILPCTKRSILQALDNTYQNFALIVVGQSLDNGLKRHI
eukprot:TRINITY_DN102244_c0_g1_i1.p1 TRINITY_DN102244_c0_g1~~TRINITY_DN102244_c0_g1_i1.p1  ORF type:complete len:110 (-),score=0.82 TRINITY_DN102244_c0_g1_i1:72-401(-)